MNTFPSFATSYSHFPFSTYLLQMVAGLKRCLAISPNQMCAVAVSIQYPQTPFGRYGESARGQMVKSEIPPPPLSCHKSCLAAQNKLLLETSLLALYPLPFITSEELQKAKKKKKKSPSCPRNLWTDNTNISKSAFLSRRQGNVCHLYNQPFLLPLWPFEEFNRANCSSFTRGDGYDLIRHLRQTVWLSHMERLQKAHFFTSVECQLEDSFPVLFFLYFQFFSSNLFQTQTAISATLYGMLYGSGMHSAIQNIPASKRRTQAMMCQAPTICSNLSPAP